MHIEYLDLGDLTGPPINLEDITRVNVLRAYAKSPTKKMLPNLRSIGAYCGEHDVTALQFLADVPEVNGHEITHYETELRRERLQAVAKRALEGPGSLNMNHWHVCDTMHCIAGWACFLFGNVVTSEESRLSPAILGARLLGPEAAAHFYDTYEDATAYLKSVLEK